MKPSTNFLNVVDEILDQAKTQRTRKLAEVTAIKEAASMPRTELGQGLRSLAGMLRSDSDDLTYADLGRSS